MARKTASQQAKTGLGLKFYIGEGADVASATWTQIEGMKSGSFPSPDKPEIDVSDTESTVREYIPGLGTMPDMSVEMNFYPDNEVHQRIVKEVVYENDVRPFKIEGGKMTFAFLGYLKSAAVSFGIDAAMTMPMVMKVTAQPVVTFSGGAGAIAWDSSLAGTEATGAVTGDVEAIFVAASGVTASFATTVTDGDPFVRGRDFTIENVPAGLTPVLEKTSATKATLTFTGVATETDDVSNIKLSFMNGAFSGATIDKLNSYSKSNIAITFV